MEIIYKKQKIGYSDSIYFNSINIHCDGSCLGNPGPGGWGVLIEYKKEEKVVKDEELSGGDIKTTNNRMEMIAAIEAIEKLKELESKISIFTDSNYLKNGITLWIKNWKKREWKKSDGKPVQNQDLWIRLDNLIFISKSKIEWFWVKGHNGNEGNERVDKIARNKAKEYQNIL
jgi:ribonuclease HI